MAGEQVALWVIFVKGRVVRPVDAELQGSSRCDARQGRGGLERK